MADAQQFAPSESSLSTCARETSALAQALSAVLSGICRLVFQTHALHRDAGSAMPPSVKEVTEQHYTSMFSAAGKLAEQLRVMGHLPPSQLEHVIKESRAIAEEQKSGTGWTVADLAGGHEQLAGHLHTLTELAANHNDPATKDWAAARRTFHEEAAWRLRSLTIL